MENNNISWDEYFMGIASLSALRSKDPNTKVGACIVDNDNKVVSIGYNGMPTGLDESKLSWLNTRHGEALKGCRLYVTLFPCNECAKACIQTGIKEIIYLEDKYADTIGFQASRKMLELAGVKLRQYTAKELVDLVK